jgi:hypothetical protein
MTAKKKTSTTKKGAARKSTTRKKATAKKQSATRKPSKKKAAKKVSAQERYQMIQETAYFQAEKDGFRPGHELQYWLQAEEMVVRRLEG